MSPQKSKSSESQLCERFHHAKDFQATDNSPECSMNPNSPGFLACSDARSGGPEAQPDAHPLAMVYTIGIYFHYGKGKGRQAVQERPQSGGAPPQGVPLRGGPCAGASCSG